MTDQQAETFEPELLVRDGTEDTNAGVVRELGDLPPGAIVNEDWLSRIFARHPTSIKRAVQRGELPPSTRLFGKPVWTAEAILQHIHDRLDKENRDAIKSRMKVQALRP